MALRYGLIFLLWTLVETEGKIRHTFWKNTLNFHFSESNTLVELFVDRPTPFLEEFFQSVAALDVISKDSTELVVNTIEYHRKEVEQLLQLPPFGKAQVKSMEAEGGKQRLTALERAQSQTWSTYLALDSSARLQRPDVVELLSALNMTFVTPVLRGSNQLTNELTRDFSQGDKHLAYCLKYLLTL